VRRARQHGSDVAADQIVPFKGELYWNFWYPGVFVGFVALGVVVWFAEQAYRRSTASLNAYVFGFSGVWLGFLVVGSIAVLSQIAFYFMWPFLAYAVARRVELRLRPSQRPIDVRES